MFQDKVAVVPFYKSMGAEAMDQWTVYRLGKDALAALVGQ